MEIIDIILCAMVLIAIFGLVVVFSLMITSYVFS